MHTFDSYFIVAIFLHFLEYHWLQSTVSFLYIKTHHDSRTSEMTNLQIFKPKLEWLQVFTILELVFWVSYLTFCWKRWAYESQKRARIFKILHKNRRLSKKCRDFSKNFQNVFLDFLSLDDNIFSKQTQIVICALLTRFSEHFEVSK